MTLDNCLAYVQTRAKELLPKERQNDDIGIHSIITAPKYWSDTSDWTVELRIVLRLPFPREAVYLGICYGGGKTAGEAILTACRNADVVLPIQIAELIKDNFWGRRD